MANLPAGLYKLSLEANPWRCDCRLRSLKEWLLSTRTPLSAPVECAQRGKAARSLPAGGQWAPEDKDNSDSKLASVMTSRQARVPSASAINSQTIDYLEQLDVDEFVCPPKAVVASNAPSSDQQSVNRKHVEIKAAANSGAGLLGQVLEYLGPTLVQGRLPPPSFSGSVSEAQDPEGAGHGTSSSSRKQIKSSARQILSSGQFASRADPKRAPRVEPLHTIEGESCTSLLELSSHLTPKYLVKS